LRNGTEEVRWGAVLFASVEWVAQCSGPAGAARAAKRTAARLADVAGHV